MLSSFPDRQAEEPWPRSQPRTSLCTSSASDFGAEKPGEHKPARAYNIAPPPRGRAKEPRADACLRTYDDHLAGELLLKNMADCLSHTIYGGNPSTCEPAAAQSRGRQPPAPEEWKMHSPGWASRNKDMHKGSICSSCNEKHIRNTIRSVPSCQTTRKNMFPQKPSASCWPFLSRPVCACMLSGLKSADRKARN